jgi:hypothetical protein
MSAESRRLAGIILIVLPTVAFGGVSILTMLINDPAYMASALRQDLWRAGHAQAGVLLLLTLIALRYVDDATLSDRAKKVVRSAIPSSAILLPAAFFLSVLRPDATEPNGFIYLAYVGFVVLITGLIILGVGLMKAPRKSISSLAILAMVALVFGCAGPPPEEPDALTERQRDSLIGASKLPGARGVERALTASDSIAARSQRLDSLARER